MPRSSAAWIKLAIFIALAGAAAYLLADLGHILRLLIIGALLAYLLDPAARLLEGRGLTRSVATVIVVAILMVALAGFIYFVFPIVAAQITGLQGGFDATDINQAVDNVDRAANEFFARFGLAAVDWAGSMREWISAQSSGLLRFVPDVVSLLTDMVIVPFIMFFLLRDGPDMKKTFISWVPNRYFEFALTVLHKSSSQLGGYLRGQATAALVVAVLSSVALRIIGVKYFIVVGVFAGIANLIPYVGPVSGALLAVIVSALTTGSLAAAPVIIVAFAAIQIIDNTFVQPLVLSRNVEMHPLGILLVVIIGGQLFGFWGLLLAVPIAAIGKVVVTEFAGNLRRFRLA